MAFLSREEIEKLGLKSVGKNVLISTFAKLYKPHLMELGDFVRIDDYCILSGKVKIGNFVHIAPKTIIEASEAGVEFEDYTGAAFNCVIIANCDSYKLDAFFGPLSLPQYKNVTSSHVRIGKYSIIGSFSTILPGVNIAEGCSFGAYSLVTKDTEAWSFYAGQPAQKKRNNSKGIIEMCELNRIKMLEINEN